MYVICVCVCVCVGIDGIKYWSMKVIFELFWSISCLQKE